MSTVAGAVLHARYADLKQIQGTRHVSIENTVGSTNNTSIELPVPIIELITGSDFWVKAKTNRYKMLIREGHLDKLLHLAHEAHSKDNPAHWFAAACSKARWEKYTLPYFAKLKTVAETAERVARRLRTSVNTFIYKMIWNGVNVERWAVTAEEMRHGKLGQSREKHFSWLCLNEKTVLAGMAAQ